MNPFTTEIPYWKENIKDELYGKGTKGFNKNDPSLLRSVYLSDSDVVRSQQIYGFSENSGGMLNSAVLEEENFKHQGFVTIKLINKTYGLIKKAIRFFIESNGEIARASFFYIPKDFILEHQDEISQYNEELCDQLESVVDVIVSQPDSKLADDAIKLKHRLLKFIDPV